MTWKWASVRRAWFVVLVVLVVAVTTTPNIARAEGRRVVVTNGDPLLVKAISRALSPWGLEIFAVTGPPFEPDIRGAVSRARDTAADAHAVAVVWTAPTANEGAAESLWVYDAATEQVVVRPLSASPPFDMPMAASIALSVKTVLRSTTIAPPGEQTAPVGAAPAPSPTSAVRPAPPTGAAPAHPPDPRWRLRLEAALGLRVLANDRVRIEPRAGLAVSIWPAGQRAGFGAALGAVSSTGVSIDRAAFTGTFTDTALGLAGRYRLPLRVLELELAAGASAHFTSIRGNDAVSGVRVGTSRVNTSLDASAVLALPLSARVDLGVVVQLSYFLKYQAYSLSTAPVFALSPFEPSTALRFAVNFD
jgi:hypothetical protein